MRWNKPTIYQLTRSEALLMEQIRLSLQKFKDFLVIGPHNINFISDRNLSSLSDANNDQKCNIMERMNQQLVMHDIEMSVVKIIDNPTIELAINNTIIAGNIQEHICKEALTNKYNRYISKKYGWNNTCIKNIDWEVMVIASAKTDKLQQFTSKLMHGWLPTRGHPGFADIKFPASTCPICNAPVDTNQYFLECNINNEVRIDQLYKKKSIKN
jgi:hypothetical protein